MKINTIIQGDCLETLKQIPDKSVNCCVTSPPYFGLRDYGHDGQIGLEETPDEYVKKIVEVFWEVKRVLRDDGTLWLNLGDSYNGSVCGGGQGDKSPLMKNANKQGKHTGAIKIIGLKPKDLVGIPWMVAFALRNDGWYLRQDIIWHKPNPMPESVTDRCTKAHEYIFLLSKSKQYYYDNGAIMQDGIVTSAGSAQRDTSLTHGVGGNNSGINRAKEKLKIAIANGETIKANKRSVWTVNTKPYSGAHFATFPEDLIMDCIKAGCPEDGIVLDPFMGAGTTALVARKLNRNFIGCELNPEYIKIAENRIKKQIGLFV